MFLFFQLTTNLQQLPEVQKAFLWWIPICLLIGGIGVTVATMIYEPITGKTLAVLGMQEAGKTQFYKTLQNEKYTGYLATSIDPRGEFDIKLKDNRTIHVREGEDIGGGEVFVKSLYKKMMNENEAIVFIFNVHRYLTDKTYSQNTNDRFDFISRHRNEKDIVIIGSHIDEIPRKGREKVIEIVRQINKRKNYADLFGCNFFVADLRNKFHVLDIAEKIFPKR